ncbi:hypothetical protein ILUMI_26856 [Ignelater luminosus]|uniref:Cytochrome P450 n=1 Tax=Ignelater luminosus TaxID=2038154 RepID=A0A8K0FY95_IGNLU|nr:hypothetical protein ILUMI_26856 [Ignelater luminosus]
MTIGKKEAYHTLTPHPSLEIFFEVFTFRSTIGNCLEKLYKRFRTPYFGIFVLNKPYLVIKNPELIRSVLITDFNYFRDRSTEADETCDPIVSQFLFVMKYPEWKPLRAKVTPVFTTAKIKNMLGLINEVAEEMKVYIETILHADSVEAKEVCAKYTTDVIATCAFGIKSHSFQHKDAEFRVIGRKMFEFNLRNAFCQSCYFMAPSLVKSLKFSFFDRSIYKFTREVFWATLEERKKTNTKRNDIIDVINQIRENSSSNDEIKFEGDRVVAQALMFYGAGFETTSGAMSFALYELCLHPTIQNKVREEIKLVLSRYGSITYEALQELKYMDMVLSETLRKYPALPFLDRICVEDYKIPNTDVVIEKGTSIFIPVFGLHYDPDYYPDPEKFDPERFSEINKGSNPACCYLPFGDGPRICIGAKFGLMEIKIGLVRILSEFEVKRSVDTPVPIEFETKCLLVASKVGLPMKFSRVTD